MKSPKFIIIALSIVAVFLLAVSIKADFALTPVIRCALKSIMPMKIVLTDKRVDIKSRLGTGI